MKTLIWVASLTIFIFSSTIVGQEFDPALYASNFTYMGGGARALAMGDASVGLSGDVNGGTWNPAGLWTIEGTVLSASYNLYNPSGEYTHSFTPDATKNNLNMNSIGHFSFVAPVRIKGHPFVFNFNFNRNNENSLTARFQTFINNSFNPDSHVENQEYLHTFNFGFSTRVYKQLSFGLLFDVYSGKRIQDFTLEVGYDSVVGAFNPDTIHVYANVRELDSITSNGFNITAGLLYKTEKLNLGAVVHTPYTITHSNDLSLYTATTHNGLPYIYDSDTLENFTMTLDFDYQNYSSTNWYQRTSFFIDPGGDRFDNYEEIPIQWNNSFGLGVGMEYFLNSDFGRIPLRAGFRYDKMPQSESVVTETFFDRDDQGEMLDTYTTTITSSNQMTSTGFGIGTGIQWSQIHLDAGYRYTSGSELIVEEYVEGILWSTQTIKDKVHEMRFTFTGYF
jgi:hypothetical protein